ncbi:MAG: hypothetical protein OEW00_01650 [candidate division Zixibacteria bacterium]|nr:hypothetical protein [candidate division Zixibacteria bacterium]
MSAILKLLLIVWSVLTFASPLRSQIVYFPTDAADFVPEDADSLFVFAEGWAVLARGRSLASVKFGNGAIYGDSLPPALCVREPVGAIIYAEKSRFREIPVIIGRRDMTLSLDRLIREYFVAVDWTEGQSEKGGVSARVGQRPARLRRFLVFLVDGRVLDKADDTLVRQYSKSRSRFDIKGLPRLEDRIAGVWIDPPKTGTDVLTAEFVRLLQSGPLLVEYWDGLGWQFLESGYLGGKFYQDVGEVKMAHAVFPPTTASNCRAMAYGGLTNSDEARNLFHCLAQLNIGYQVLEGDRCLYPVPGKVRLHPADSPEEKDLLVYQSARSIIDSGAPPLVFMHYHGLDDLLHTCGPYGKRTVAHFLHLLEWHRELTARWTGNILIISDHGGHAALSEGAAGGKTGDRNGEGSHGDFIFADMAIPLIVRTGDGAAETDFRLTPEQATTIWQELAAPLGSNDRDDPVEPGSLHIVIADRRFVYDSAEDELLFNEDYDFEYSRKGKQFSGHFRGCELSSLVSAADLSNMKSIVVHSFDGQRAGFSTKDLVESRLVLALDRSASDPRASFTLYPLNDRHPNRIVKEVKLIEIF